MHHPATSKAMAIGAGKHLEATGIIKKVFPHTTDPYGFVLLLTPLELRGQEASFFYSDLKIDADEREYLRVGMQLTFSVIDKPVDNMRSPVDYKAIELMPLTPAFYQAAVVRQPSEHGTSLRVAVDLTLEQVKITPASYSKLKRNKHLKLGDPCVVQLEWKEMINATKEKRTLEGEIISACRLHLPVGGSHEGIDTASEETVPSCEDSSPEEMEHAPRGGKSTPRKLTEPKVRTKPQTPTTPKLVGSFKADHGCPGSKQDPRRCFAPCCQDPCVMTPKIPPFPLPTMNGLCPCAGCSVIRQNYAMIPPGRPPCYPMDIGAPAWSNVNGY